MLYKFPLTIFLVAVSFALHAQSLQVKLILQKTNTDSIVNASIQWYRLPDSNLVTTQIVTAGGNSFSVQPFTKYLFRISGIGYQTIEKTIAVTNKDIVLPVQLQKQNTALKEVVVTSKKPIIKQDDDKTIVDAEVLANSSSNAYEVLEKTPGAIVDQDGNVYLNSANPATVMINCRIIKLSAEDLSSLLKSLPAGSISKVEIIRTPSAKYDAASSGGIVNIVLKKGVKLGSSGNMNIGYFQGVYSTETAGFNINKSSDKLSNYLSYQWTDRNNYEELTSGRVLPLDNSTLVQKAYTTYPGTNHNIGVGSNADITKKFNIAYDGRFTSNDSRSNASNKTTISNNGNQQSIANNESVIRNNGNSIYAGNNISTRYKIDSLESEWTTEFDYNYYKNNNQQLYDNYYFFPAQPSLLGNGNLSSRKNIFTAQTDLVVKTKQKITFEAGFKTTVSSSNNAAEYFRKTGSGPLTLDSFQTNTFKYKEAIISSYLQVSKSFFGFRIKPGIRMEITNIRGNQLFPKDTSLAIRRTDFFPYLYIRHRLVKLLGFELNGNVIYRRSISRPYYEALNPYPKYVDQYLFEVGNPSLRPQFTTNYEFNIVADDFPIFSIGVNDTKDIFSNVTYQDDVTKIAYRTYDNLGKNKELYLRFVGGIPPGGKYFFYAGAQHNFTEYDGFYQNQPLSYKRGSWSFFTYQQFNVTKKLNISANGFMRTKGVFNFYELKNFGSFNISINKKILDSKGTLVLSANDLFRTNKSMFTLNQGNVNAFGERINDTRKIGLTFRYSFGIKPREEKQPAFGQPVEGN